MKRSVGLSITFVLAMVVIVVARQNTGPLLCPVKVQEDVNAVVCNKKGERFMIESAKEPARLPVGRYYIDSWTIERIDEDGTRWKLKAKDISSKKTFDVTEDAVVKLSIGEAVHVRSRGESLEISRDLSL